MTLILKGKNNGTLDISYIQNKMQQYMGSLRSVLQLFLVVPHRDGLGLD